MRTDIFHHTPENSIEGLASANIFNDNSSFCGKLSETTPHFILKMGCACASVSDRIAVSASEHEICKLLTAAFIAGASFAGAQVSKTDADFPALAAFVASAYNFELAVFIEHDGNNLRIRFLDRNGFSISKEMQNEINFRYNREKFTATTITDSILPKKITGTKELFSAKISRDFSLTDFSVAVREKSTSCNTLKLALTMCGCRIVQEEEGVLLFDVSQDGYKLRIRDEKGIWLDEAHISALIAFIHFSKDNKSLAVIQTAPGVMEQIASEAGGEILRVGRDESAVAAYIEQDVLKNAVFDAVYLCSYLLHTKETLFSLLREIPDFTMISREVQIKGDKQKIISELAKTKDGLYKENIDSLRICTDGGWINIAPSRSGHSLQVTAESFNEEIASELCNLFIERASHLDTPDV